MEAKPGVLGGDLLGRGAAGFARPSSPRHQLEIEGYVPAPNEQMMIHRATVPPGLFQAAWASRCSEGRDFTERDESRRRR